MELFGNEQFRQPFQKCQEMFAKGQRSNWDYEWFRAFNPVFDGFINSLNSYSVLNVPGVKKQIELSAPFLLQAVPKIMPHMPKFSLNLNEYHLLSKLNNLAWLHDSDELAKVARIVKGEEAGAVTAVKEKTFDLTAKPTIPLRRLATDLDDALEESSPKKVARPIEDPEAARTAEIVVALNSHEASISSKTRKTCAPGISFDAILDALNGIRDSFAEGIKRLDELETLLVRP